MEVEIYRKVMAQIVNNLLKKTVSGSKAIYKNFKSMT